MNDLNRYSIEYKGIDNGKHTFRFVLDDSFFASFDADEVKSGRVVVDVELDKSSSMLRLLLHFGGEVEVECDRCLDRLSLPVDGDEQLDVKFGESSDEFDGEVMWISASEPSVDLARYLYESVILRLPAQRVHSSLEQCNAEMTARFNIVTPDEFDRLTESVGVLGESSAADALRELKEQMENNGEK